LARHAAPQRIARLLREVIFVLKIFIGNDLCKSTSGLAQSLLITAPIRQMAAKSAIARVGVLLSVGSANANRPE
jgi:hypothetical protein